MSSALETLCGQAFGAKQYNMLSVYMQRSIIILFITGLFILPIFLFTTPILKFLGQPPELAELAGVISMALLPGHFTYAFYLPFHFFLQSQLKSSVIGWMAIVALLVHLFLSWLVVIKFQLGVVALVAVGNVAWWVLVFGYFGYIVCGGCPLTWTGFSLEAFSGLWDFTKLSGASGVMLWYFFLTFLFLLYIYIYMQLYIIDSMLNCAFTTFFNN